MIALFLQLARCAEKDLNTLVPPGFDYFSMNWNPTKSTRS